MEPAAAGSPYPASPTAPVHFSPSGEVRTLQHPTATNWLPDQATVMRSVSSVRRLLHMDPGFPDARVHAGPSRPRALRVAPRSARNSPCAARMASSLFHHFGRRSDCLIVGRQRVARAEEIGDGLARHLPNLRARLRERVA